MTVLPFWTNAIEIETCLLINETTETWFDPRFLNFKYPNPNSEPSSMVGALINQEPPKHWLEPCNKLRCNVFFKKHLCLSSIRLLELERWIAFTSMYAWVVGILAFKCCNQLSIGGVNWLQRSLIQKRMVGLI
jgi:hypothetical protein